MNETNNTGKYVGLAAVVLALLLAGYFMLAKPEMPTDATVPTTEENPTGEEGTPTSTLPVETPTARYKDGEYTAVGNYVSPGGPEAITVTLTLKNDVVTAATVKNNPQNPTTQQFQGKFLSGYNALVVGKSLDAVALSKVSGSSLTPKGWNDAVTKIKAQAEA